jgi:hypothetical protein
MSTEDRKSRLERLSTLRTAAKDLNKKATKDADIKVPKPSLKMERKRKLAEELLALQQQY